jgi:hypothetical protein
MNGSTLDGTNGFAGISWPTLATGTVATDDDNDGMPDAWEAYYFDSTSSGSPKDSTADFDSDGYTDLEEYLNGTDPTAP